MTKEGGSQLHDLCVVPYGANLAKLSPHPLPHMCSSMDGVGNCGILIMHLWLHLALEWWPYFEYRSALQSGQNFR